MKSLKFYVFVLVLNLFSFTGFGWVTDSLPADPKVAVYTKATSDTNKIILVGLDNPNFAPVKLNEFLPVGATNPENGFEPKYLISVNESGPQLIYSFELGSNGSSDLPNSLINVPKTKRSKFKEFLLPRLLNDPAVLLVRHFVDKNSFRRSNVGSYLLHILETSLIEKKDFQPDKRHFSPLLEALDGENEIPVNTLAVAAALTVKYHPNGRISGPLAHNGNLIDDYSTNLDKRFEKISEQFSKLQIIAAKSNLRLRPLSPFYALVEYNCQTPLSLNLVDRLNLELTGPNYLKSYEEELCADRASNIPLVIVALNPAKSFFIPLINFRDTNSEKNRELVQIIKNLSIEAAGHVIPFAPSIILSTGDMLVGLTASKTGTTLYRVDRASLYPQLRVEGDFNILNLDTLGVEDQVFQIHITKMKKVEPSEKEGVLQGLRSENNEAKKEAMNEAVSLMAYDQAGIRFFKSNDKKYFEKKQIESWQAFIKNNEEILQALH